MLLNLEFNFLTFTVVCLVIKAWSVNDLNVNLKVSLSYTLLPYEQVPRTNKVTTCLV